MAKPSVKNTNTNTKKKTGKGSGLKEPWKPGQSGNPKGRPKKEVCIPDILKRLANEISDYDPEKKKTNLELICGKAVELAISGDRDARAWIANRMEGMPQQSINMKSDVNLSIQEKLKQLSNLSIDEVISEINKAVLVD